MASAALGLSALAARWALHGKTALVTDDRETSNLQVEIFAAASDC